MAALLSRKFRIDFPLLFKYNNPVISRLSLQPVLRGRLAQYQPLQPQYSHSGHQIEILPGTIRLETLVTSSADPAR